MIETSHDRRIEFHQHVYTITDQMKNKQSNSYDAIRSVSPFGFRISSSVHVQERRSGMNVISFLFVFFFRVFFYFQWKIEFVPSWRGKGPVFYMTIDVNRLLLQWRVGVQYSGCIKRGGGKYWSHQKAKFDGETKERGSFVNFISHFFLFLLHSFWKEIFVLFKDIS